MSRTGDRLRALAARVCSPRALERVLDPAIADLRWEHRNALRQQRPWRARWIGMTGSITVLYLIVRCASASPSQTRNPSPAGMIAGAAAVVALMTATLIALIVSNTPAPIAHRPWLMLYLLPATLPCTVPCGFAVAVSWMDGRRSGALQSAPATLIFASGLSIVALITVGWLVPASNQAYRTTVEGWQIPRGFNELTLPEQRRQLSVERERLSLPFGAQHHPVDPTFDIRGFEFTYHGRFAVSAAPLALGLFGLGISRRGYAVRRIAMLCVLAMYFIWYGWDSPVQTFGRLSPALVAWLPNLALLTATTLLWTGARAAPRHLRAGGANGDRRG